jgi:hypothetical protein
MQDGKLLVGDAMSGVGGSGQITQNTETSLSLWSYLLL